MWSYELGFQIIWSFVIWSPGSKITAVSVRLRKSLKNRCSYAILQNSYLLDYFVFEANFWTVDRLACALSFISFNIWLVHPQNWPNRDKRAGCRGFDRFAYCYRLIRYKS